MIFAPVLGRKPDVSNYLLFEEDDEVERTLALDFDPIIMVNFFKDHEKLVPYMYRDTLGYPTVGVGHMIPSRMRAAELPFQYKDPLTKERRPATRDEIEIAYDQLPGQAGQQNNFSFTFYEPQIRKLIPLYLDHDEIDQILKNDIHYHYDQVRHKFDHFDTYPVLARCALLDLQFNMGGRFNAEKWPKLFGAVRDRQWLNAGDESNRPQVPKKRNDVIKNLFYGAWRGISGYGAINRQV